MYVSYTLLENLHVLLEAKITITFVTGRIARVGHLELRFSCLS